MKSDIKLQLGIKPEHTIELIRQLNLLNCESTIILHSRVDQTADWIHELSKHLETEILELTLPKWIAAPCPYIHKVQSCSCQCQYIRQSIIIEKWQLLDLQALLVRLIIRLI